MRTRLFGARSISYRIYKTEIPSLFSFNEVLVVSDGLEARIGSLTADDIRFMKWRTIEGDELAPPLIPQLQVLISGVFDKRRFLKVEPLTRPRYPHSRKPSSGPVSHSVFSLPADRITQKAHRNLRTLIPARQMTPRFFLVRFIVRENSESRSLGRSENVANLQTRLPGCLYPELPTGLCLRACFSASAVSPIEGVGRQMATLGLLKNL